MNDDADRFEVVRQDHLGLNLLRKLPAFILGHPECPIRLVTVMARTKVEEDLSPHDIVALKPGIEWPIEL